MKVVMIRKAASKAEWHDAYEGIRQLFGREPQTVDAVVEKEIVLTDAEFEAFENDLLTDNEIIQKHKELMQVDGNGIWHCIAITTATAKYRILVDSEGSDYARYTAIVQK